MNIYAIADLHLALSEKDKNMELFGAGWGNYMNRIESNWRAKVRDDDFIIISGDSSWAMRLEDAFEDFKFINSLPGKKLIVKGNHDYWWTTGNKMNNYLKEKNLNTITFLQNTSFNIPEYNITVCGTRGWKNPGDAGFKNDDRKIYEREIIRLELSLEHARSQSSGEIIAALHYPPFLPENISSGDNKIIKLLNRYGVKVCIFGHIHFTGSNDKWKEFAGKNVISDDISFYLVSSDFISFNPVKIY